MDNSNCSDKERFMSCHDGHCIPKSLRCNAEENCGEGYDEDCYVGKYPENKRQDYLLRASLAFTVQQYLL